ncbi:MAG: hypothetical protein MI919_13880, partial [Holophagales bacterium]|nr:hypothetical protein [Holophagales bacterium]
VEFLKPMSWDDELEVQVQTREVSERSFSLALRGTVEGATTFTAELTLVCISKETFRPVEIPEDLKHELKARTAG